MDLLNDLRVAHRVSSKTERDQQLMQIDQGRQRHSWLAKLHTQAGDRVQHPGRHPHDDTGSYFDMDNVASNSLLAAFPAQTTSVEWMPTIVNDNKLRSVCRMTCDLAG